MLRRAWLLIAGAEAPYFWLIGAVLKIPSYPHGQEGTKHFFNPPVWPIAQPHLIWKVSLTGSIATPRFWLVTAKDYLEWNRKLVGIKRNLAFDSIDRIKMAQGIYLQAHLLLELLDAVILALQNDV